MAGAEEELLEAWRAGDTDAGTALFRRYFPLCRRFFLNKVPERDLDDLLQSTFTAMVSSRDRFRGASSFRSFVLAIARRLLMRYLRDYARRESRREIDFNVSSVAALAITPGTAIAMQRDEERVRVALQRIPVHFQTILELSYWEGVSNEELSEILAVEPTTVRTRLFRARRALGEALQAMHDDDDATVDAAMRALGKHL